MIERERERVLGIKTHLQILSSIKIKMNLPSNLPRNCRKIVPHGVHLNQVGEMQMCSKLKSTKSNHAVQIRGKIQCIEEEQSNHRLHNRLNH